MEKKNVEALAPQICNMLPNGLKIEIFYWKFKSQVSLWFRAKSRLCSINCRFDPFSKDVLVVVGVAFFFIFTTFISHSLIPSFRNVCSVKNILSDDTTHKQRTSEDLFLKDYTSGLYGGQKRHVMIFYSILTIIQFSVKKTTFYDGSTF